VLSALTTDNPAVAAQVEALWQWGARLGLPDLVDRAIRGGYIVHRQQIVTPRKLDEPGSFAGEMARVQSSSDPQTLYAVSRSHSAFGKWHCECRDWRDGRARLVLDPANPDYPPTGAPHLKSFGFACKHVLAVHIALRLAGYKFRQPPQAREPDPARDRLERGQL
jgi:hypothetical protein